MAPESKALNRSHITAEMKTVKGDNEEEYLLQQDVSSDAASSKVLRCRCEASSASFRLPSLVPRSTLTRLWAMTSNLALDLDSSARANWARQTGLLTPAYYHKEWWESRTVLDGIRAL